LYTRTAATHSGKLVKEAQQTTRAAQDAARAAKDAISTERAWIVFDGITRGPVQNSTVDGVLVRDGFVVIIGWRNAGRSPALAARAIVRREIWPADRVGFPAFPRPAPIEDGGVLGPQMPIASQEVVLNDAEWADFSGLRTRV